MRFIWAFIWSLLLSSMVVYVISNMSGKTFDFVSAIALGVGFAVIITVIGDGVLKDDEA
ncbi:hypothetical protein HNQ94_001479 [Salirhabdus euzebyi]|uniref:DUF2929 family protein n=1 Tax=Salirhabdus euzebyi TaxID=394506 RepID=A0A841Q3P7_9BACI|nr:YjzD family protein [Salirhabdus euzebyi]MBB6453031.1 hypothetical protein [Salirhabdus euzebyi]